MVFYSILTIIYKLQNGIQYSDTFLSNTVLSVHTLEADKGI